MKQELALALSRRQGKQQTPRTNPIPSAVLVPIFCKEGEYHLLFTRRTEKVKYHKGQISFPGGARHKSDRTILDTALRETAEEIGLKEDAVEVVGKLDDVVTATSNYLVSPFVGFIPYPYDFKIQEFEVQEIIEVPISALLDKSCLSRKKEIAGGQEVSEFSYQYRDRVIWGATARILNQFLEIYAEARQTES